MPDTWGSVTANRAIRAPVDPKIRLCFAVVGKAVKDLKEADPLIALDALCFWLEDGPGWLEMLDLCDPEDDRYFQRLIGRCANG